MEKSIYERISESLVDGVLPDGFSLPDEADSAPVKFAPGAFDGICIYHMGLDELDDEGRAELGRALASASTGDRAETDALFFEWTKKHRALSMVDEIQNYVRDHKDELKIGYMYQSAKYMIFHSAHIECVKIALELMEMFRGPMADVVDAVRVLGLYDEFTIFAVWNLRKWEDGNEEVFDLAKKVRGWGRIHAVEFLEPDTDEIRRWLLLEGCENDVMPAYSALTVWEKCGAEELLKGKPTQEEFEAILRIIEGLLDEGPCLGISRVENAESVLLRVLELMPDHVPTLDGCGTVLGMKHWAEKRKEPLPAVVRACDEVLHLPACIAVIRDAAREGKALDLAQELGIPFREDLLRAMRADFEKHCGDVRYLMNDGEYYAQAAMALFREKLPLSAMKGDPVDDLCLGDEYKNHNMLQYMIQELDGRPLEGADFVRAGLESPASRNRSRALKVLQAWVSAAKKPLSELAPPLFDVVKNRLAKEIDPGPRFLAEPLLEGKTEFEEDHVICP
ncbi:MAG: hypothetical protein II581_04295 [Oscillospiraceae bacterium]|nr:hypothetical protein [Oscillospiraceae bacterium]